MKLRAWALCLLALTGHVEAAEPVITTFAGGGSSIGDGGPATTARLVRPTSVAVDAVGNVYIAEGADTYDACRVRKVDKAGTITTHAGNGTRDVMGESVPATSVSVCPTALALDAAGNLYIGEHFRVRRVTPGGIISTVAGTGKWGFSGDGGQATRAQVGLIHDLAVDTAGQLYIVDNASSRIRRIDTQGVIRTIAGNGEYNASGDGGPALSAGMSPRSVLVDSAGNVFFSDGSNDTLRRIGTNGIVNRLAGGGPFRVDPLAINSDMYYPRGLALGSNGHLYVANESNLAHIISPTGILKVFAGRYNNSTFDSYGAPAGFYGDGGPANMALLNQPQDVAVDAMGNVYIADTYNDRIRRVTPVPSPYTPSGIEAFHPAVTYQVGRYPSALDLGDFNRDGRVDVVVVTDSWGSSSADPATDYRLNVLLQNSNGTLAAPSRLAFAPVRYVGRLRAADLNRDGYSDVVLATGAGLSVYLGSATGLHVGPVLKGVADAEVPADFVMGDMDRDGFLDVVAWMAGQSEGGTSPADRYGITIFYGNGQGGMARQRFLPLSNYGGRLAWGDANRDGRSDLLMAWAESTSDSGVAVFHHDGVDAFLTPPQFARIGQGGYNTDITVGDFDGNDKLDVILSRENNAPQAALAHFEQTDSNTLTFVAAWQTYDSPKNLITRDINGDGRHDLLVLHSGWSSVGLQPQLATAGLDIEVKYYLGVSGNAHPGTLAAGDLNGDGCSDVAFSDYNWQLQVLYSKGCLRSPSWSRPRVPAGGGIAAAFASLPGTSVASMDSGTSVDRPRSVTAIAKRFVLTRTAQARAYMQRATAREVAAWSALVLFVLALAWHTPAWKRLPKRA